MRNIISSFFQLVSRVPFKLFSNAINKVLRVSKVFLRESFDVKSYNKSDTFMGALILSLSGVNSAIKV